MSARGIQVGLVHLALRRTVSGGALFAALVLAVLLPWVRWVPAQLPTGVTSLTGLPLGGGLARQGIWATFLAVIGTLLVVKSAATIATWRRGEADWRGSAVASRGVIVLSDWIGKMIGAGLLLLFAAASAELGAPGGNALRHVRQIEAPRIVLVRPDRPATWSPDPAGDLREGHTLRAPLFLAGGGPAAGVRFAARRGTGPWVEVRHHMAGRTDLELVLPGGEGALELLLERQGPGSIVALDPRGLDLLVPASGARAATAALFARAWLALAAACALALGFGAWASAGGAAGLALALPLLAWLGTTPSVLWPWHGLPTALALAGEGLVPSLPQAAQLAGGGLFVALGLALAAAGLRSWRRAP